MNFFTRIFQGFKLDVKLLLIVLFLGIISWKGASGFNGGASFLSGGCAPWGASVLMRGSGSKKNEGWGGGGMSPTMGNPVLCRSLLCMVKTKLIFAVRTTHDQ